MALLLRLRSECFSSASREEPLGLLGLVNYEPIRKQEERELMRGLIIIFLMMILSLGPVGLYAQSEAGVLKPPFLAQALVREDDFAGGLAKALDIGTAADEAEALSLLVSCGIEPENGWISDQPMIFKIFHVLEAAEDLAARLGLPVVVEASFQAVAQMLPRPGELKIVPNSPAPPLQPAQPPSSPSPLFVPNPGGHSTMAPEKGTYDPRTGDFYPGSFGGVTNPRTGSFYPKVDGGYLNTDTGNLIPAKK
jgi:hypothetical protein